MLTNATNLNVNIEKPAPSYTMFNSGSVALATVLGGPIPGTILMATNYRRMGQSKNAVLAVLAGIGAMALAMGLGVLLPQAPSMPIAIVLVVVLSQTAKALQGAAVEQHVNQGGRLGSKWIAFGLGMVFLAVVVGIILLPLLGASKVAAGS